ncbi:ABC transporter ATP-binding protein [Saccharibacillus endophyticus]|uniref:Bacitracin ABC transporter ATP-binding protein n=1 Tax=Saccharibacillus endophyticus TaxID=2060666 RepID=A0ABQ1ZQV5_9BACL|nr:ABC transporter ATP-binding protein [Saccharibacillus endophyticus]GGH71808.1 bacitracin ABC transporter ATP-binding protein [Saccharibacillus endophyticus]
MNQSDDGFVLRVRDLNKRIGRKTIIHSISFDVREGEIFGFLGPNGAGKTTTIRMLVGLIKPTSGSVEICGFDVQKQPEEALKHVGSIVENPEMYPYLTGWENLMHFARMQDGIDERRIREVTELVHLGGRIHEKVRTYSLGMRQRLGIAQALLARPKVLILDEPTNGLDPKGIKEMRAFIRELASAGLAVFVSSHLLSEIQLLCDRVAIIGGGRELAVGSVDELMGAGRGMVIWDVEPKAAALTLLAEYEDIVIVDSAGAEALEDAAAALLNERSIVTETPEERVAEVLDVMVREGIAVRGVHRVAPTLERLFLQMTEGEGIE